eukprot:2601985-Rhodomonas_salina.1
MPESMNSLAPVHELAAPVHELSVPRAPSGRPLSGTQIQSTVTPPPFPCSPVPDQPPSSYFLVQIVQIVPHARCFCH